MYYYYHFKPGKPTNSSRMIKYIAELHNNTKNIQFGTIPCLCVLNKYDKNTLGSDSPSIKVSNNRRISQIIQYSKGGKTQYGNFYLGQPLNVNYLGRIEGMAGGSGTPPTNKF